MAKRQYRDGERWRYGAGHITHILRATGSRFKAEIYLNGHHTRQPTKTFPTRTAAEQWIDDMAVQSRQGTLGPTTRPKTTHQALRDYLDHISTEARKGNVRPRTLADYTRVNAKLRDVLPNIPLPNLTPTHINTALLTLSTTYGQGEKRKETLVNGKRKLAPARKATVAEANRALLQLRRVLGYAVERQWLTQNPAKTVKLLKKLAPLDGEDTWDDRNVWEPGEATQFLERNREHRLYPLFYLALSVGPRVGELMGLEWGDVDWGKGTLRIARSWDPRNGLGPPKWGSRRTVSLTPATLAVLKEHRAALALERVGAGQRYKGIPGRDLMFPSTVGTYTSHENVRRTFNNLIRLSGLRRITVHGLRHTATSGWIRATRDPVLVAGVMGHKDPALTLRVYAHLFEEHRRETVMDAGSLYPVPVDDGAGKGAVLLN